MYKYMYTYIIYIYIYVYIYVYIYIYVVVLAVSNTISRLSSIQKCINQDSLIYIDDEEGWVDSVVDSEGVESRVE